jgi:hypothetical protein
MAVLALIAMMLGRVIAPSMKGLVTGLQRVTDVVDYGAGIFSHVLALGASALIFGSALLVAREVKVSLATRIVLLAETTIVLFVSIPASRTPLAPLGCMVIGLMASLIGITGGAQGLREPRSRALGAVLMTTSIAGGLRVIASMLLSFSSAQRAVRYQAIADVLSTLSMLLFAGALLIALLWLASRRRTIAPPSTLLALVLSVVWCWLAAKGQRHDAGPWFVFFDRALDHLTPIPHSLLPLPLANFFSAMGPSLAVGALITRRQMPTVIGALSLVLIAGPLIDAPAHALILVLAAFATVLASRDDRGMWETLLGRPLREGERGL